MPTDFSTSHLVFLLRFSGFSGKSYPHTLGVWLFGVLGLLAGCDFLVNKLSTRWAVCGEVGVDKCSGGEFSCLSGSKMIH